MSWKKTIKTVDDSVPTKSWRDTITTISDEPSELESLVRGAAQGATFGFSDELTGALESLLTDKTYEQARDESRQNYDKAQNANPLSYGTGEIGTAIGMSLIPGVGIIHAGRGATTAARVGMAAAQGGLTGAGLSDEDSVEGVLKDSAKGATIGAAFQGIGEKVISPVLNKAGSFVTNKLSGLADDSGDLATQALKKIGKVAADIPESDTARYLNNPKAVNSSMSIGELGEDLLKTTDASDSLISQMHKRASDLSSNAWSTLNPDSSISKSSIKQAIADIQDGLLTDGVLLGDNQARAFQKLNQLAQQFDQLPNSIPEPTMKRVIQALDANINWNDPNGKVVNEALRDVRGFVDGVLKEQNPAYKMAMESTEEVSKAIQTVKSAFQNRQNPESFDKFIKSVKNLNNKSEHSSVGQALDKIKQHTGFDLREQILNSQAKSSFAKDTTNGSRKTLTGALIGSGAGSMMGPLGATVGGAIGGAAGATGDKFSGVIFKQILDGKISADAALDKIAPSLGKFYSPLKEAAKRGNNSLAATHFILSQRDPEYRKLINENKEE